MQKTVLERFIAKYYLSGAAESVLWTATKKELSTRFISDDKNVLGFVRTSEIVMDEGEYGIYDTSRLSSLLSPLDSDIQLKVNRSNGKAASLTFRDADARATFMLAEKSIIPAVPDIKALPPFETTITIDEKFTTKFVRGKASLPEVDNFTILTADDKTQIVIGYSATLNTNRFALHVDASGKPLERAIMFSAKYLRDILIANKEAKRGLIKVSSKGLAYVTFEIDGFSAEYYLVEIQSA